jgi:Tol biopolymer transport system component
MKHTRGLLAALGLCLCLASPSRAQATRRINVSTAGHQANGQSLSPSISADGLRVVFDSEATNLAGSDFNSSYDVFCRKWPNSRTDVESVDSSESIGNGDSSGSAISGDGDYVVFHSAATNLVPGDTNGQIDVFIRNRILGTTQRVSVGSGGSQGDDDSYNPGISPDGRFVVFESTSTSLVPGDTNGFTDIFLRDRLSAVTERISLTDAEGQSNGGSSSASVSADGRYVAFVSNATNLVPGDTNADADIFVRDRVSGTTVRASVNSSEWEVDGASSSPVISADGRFVAFSSNSNDLIGPLAFDFNGVSDVFVRDLVNGATSRVSVSATAEGNGGSFSPSISADGRFVAFSSSASNLVAGDTNGDSDIFVRDRTANTIERVSLDSDGLQADGSSSSPSISADGRFVAFSSFADDLVTGDTNDEQDIFLRDRNPSGFTSVCHPGVAGVMACPCANPPSVEGRGCNNSSSTGGAFLTAAGLADISADSLVFTTFAEKPTALSILLQGDATIAAGLVYGQGVRCVGGSLERLFTKTASTGSITAPDFGAGDRTVTAQSEAKGDTILPGESRWYLVYYRDGQILGGCPSTSTFNATQTGRVTWIP